MRQFDTKATTTIGDITFYIRPFGAFTAANISGDLIALLLPSLGGAIPALVGKNDRGGILDMDAEQLAPALARGVASLNGDKVERLLKKLLTEHANISYCQSGKGSIKPLTDDDADELFCGEADGLFVLAKEVIMANFGGFFGKLGSQFGNPRKEAGEAEPS